MNAFVVLLFLALQDLGVITGVIRSSDGTPAAGVRVFARPAAIVAEDQTVLEAQTETDASGRYRLEIRPGQYNVGTGFLNSPTWYPGTIELKTARPVVVSANATLPLDITALPTSVIAGNIQLQVVSAVTGSPMPTVTVVVTGTLAPSVAQPGQRGRAVARPAPRLTGETDASGNVAFRSLAPGRYTVQPRFNGYLVPNPSSILIDETHVSQKLQVGLTPSAAISGRLFGPDGKPLGSTLVWAGSLQYLDGRRKMVARVRAQTNPDGTYRLEPLEPGAYYVVAETVSGRLGLGSTFYPGTANFDDATAVVLRDAQSLAGIEFKALNVRTFSVSGRVLDTAGARISTFNLVPHDPAAAEPPQTIVVTNDSPSLQGDFTLRGIPAGSWDLYPVTPTSVAKTGSGHVEVIDRDVQGVAIRLDPFTEIRGRVAVPDGPALPPIRISLAPRNNRPMSPGSLLVSSQNVQPPDGRFAFAGVLPGKYSVQVSNVPADYHVAGLRVGNEDVFETGVLDIGPGAIAPVEVVLAKGGASFRGFFNITLAYMSADQLRNVRVTLVPSGTRRSNLALYQTLSIPRAGEPFVFTGVVPGEYKVFAWSKLPENAEKSPEFLKRHEKFGAPVHVTADGAGDVQVSVIEMP